MSNALSIPAVTASITAVLQARYTAGTWASIPQVAPGGPDDTGTAPYVMLHLYRVDRNGYRDNEDLPTRSGDGSIAQKPRTSLDLHYLLIFHGKDAYETQRMMGVAAAALHAVPVLSRDLVSSVGSTYSGADGNDLDRADECVRVSPESLSLDELTRLWALYTVDSFRPTLGYLAGPVVIEADDVAGTVLPVAAFALGARPLSAPRLDEVAGPDGPGSPIRAAATAPTLHLLGAALSPQAGETLEVVVDGVAVASAAVTVVSDRELTLAAPSQRPGQHSVQVNRRGAALSTLSLTRPASSSQPARYTMLPTLDAVAASGVITAAGESKGTLSATVRPAVDQTQRVRLLLDSQTADPPVSVVVPIALGAVATTSVSASFDQVPSDDYRVTLEVDGVRSVPKLDANGHYILPAVAL